ncbi:MAG: hypothetical protein LBK00_10080 [Treponema sp.]|jgi:uncharacterized membrane protein YhaH (DUF805 family)|nr:hypothetical protein [Treponema sp.]
MLGKLLKYDFKAFLRIMVPFYLALMALSLLAGLSQGRIAPDGASEPSPLTIIWGIAVVVVVTVNIIMLIQRFRDNLLKDEGYLMFTLPVTRWQLLVSKALTALVSLIISGLALILSVLLFEVVSGPQPHFVEELSEFLQRITDQNHITMYLLNALVVLIVVFQQICLIYTVLLGSQILPRFRVLAALGVYILVMYVESRIILAVVPYFPQTTYAPLLGQGAISIVFAGLYFWLCGWLLHHTLNME